MDERRAALDQEAHGEAVDRFGVYDVVIVEHQDKRVVAGCHLVDDRCADQVRGRVRRGSEQAQGGRAGLRSNRRQRGGEVADEPGEVVVGRSSASHAWATARREPARDCDRLAVARRCGEHRQARPVLQRPIEHVGETRTFAVSRDRERTANPVPTRGPRTCDSAAEDDATGRLSGCLGPMGASHGNALAKPTTERAKAFDRRRSFRVQPVATAVVRRPVACRAVAAAQSPIVATTRIARVWPVAWVTVRTPQVSATSPPSDARAR